MNSIGIHCHFITHSAIYTTATTFEVTPTKLIKFDFINPKHHLLTSIVFTIVLSDSSYNMLFPVKIWSKLSFSVNNMLALLSVKEIATSSRFLISTNPSATPTLVTMIDLGFSIIYAFLEAVDDDQ